MKAHEFYQNKKIKNKNKIVGSKTSTMFEEIASVPKPSIYDEPMLDELSLLPPGSPLHRRIKNKEWYIHWD